MLLDLIDSLRCPAPHPESWLVLSADTWDDRHIVEGRLGCPVCHAEYAIHGGVADFTGGKPPPVAVRVPSVQGRPDPLDPDGVFRLAAQLDLREPGGVVLLAGAYAALAPSLSSLVPALYAVVNAASSVVDPVSALGVAVQLPLGAGAVRAIALDERHATPPLLEESVRVLRGGGRIVAPSSIPLPAGVREMARDDREWVGAATGAPGPVVTLHRAR